MALLTGDELRLLYAILLNAAALWATWRVARRLSEDRLDAAGDALLLYFLIQYASVCVPGVLRVLHPIGIGAFTLLVVIAIAWTTARRPLAPASPKHLPRRESLPLIGAAAFVVSYLAALMWHQRPLPVISNDAITYHLPAAVQWLQTGRLGLYETWYYNPANSYSPLAGSAFIAWWLAPLGNDALARFVQVGPLLMLFVAMLNLCRRIGANVGAAALIAASAVMTRSFVSQSILAKDDLFVAAFFVIAVNALSRQRLEQRFGALRAGIALGLLLATKYTVLFSMPLLLLMINHAWTWRRIVIVSACALLLAGPWYLRNVILTGNPVYPTELRIAGYTVLRGMMNVQRSKLLATPGSTWNIFTGGYYGMTPAMAWITMAGWLGAIFAAGKRIWRDPLTRICILGPPIGITLFILTAPYGEMRFAYPSILLLFGALAIALLRLPRPAEIALAAIVALTAAASGFALFIAGPLTLFALAMTALVVTLVAIDAFSKRLRMLAPYAAAVALLAIAMFIYVHWTAYVESLEHDSAVAWSYPPPDAYGSIGEVWAFVRHELPRGATIAYANTYFTYPLMGYRYDHRVVHAPVRRDLEQFTALPHLGKRVTGEETVGEIVAMLRENPDRERWLQRLRHSGAQHLVIGKQIPAHGFESVRPLELSFVQDDPRFTRVFENDAGSVFEIRW